MKTCALLLLSLLALWAPHAHAMRCDGPGSSSLKALSPDDGSLQTLTLTRRFCSVEGGRSGSIQGLSTAEGRRLVPAEFVNIITLNAGLSLVQKDDLDATPEDDEGWYLYTHGRGLSAKLPWARFTVLTPRSQAAQPGVVVAVGDAGGPSRNGPQRFGLITSFMREVQSLEGLQGHWVDAQIDWFAQVRGERRALEFYRNHALVLHGAQGSQIVNLQGEPITPLLADLQLLQGGRDAVTTLMKARHRDLPQPSFTAHVPGQTEDMVYMPIDQDGSLMSLPEGAIGVMWFPGLSAQHDAYVAGWAIVFPKGEGPGAGIELAIGNGPLTEVLRRAEHLPRYAGMKLGSDKSTAYRLVLKLLEGGWITVNSATLRVDERTQQASQPGPLLAQARKEVLDRYLAARQQALDRIAELQRLREQEAQRVAQAAANARAELDRLRQQAQSGDCSDTVRRVLSQLDADSARSYLSRCGLYGSEEHALARRVGVESRIVEAAEAEHRRRNGQLEAERARNAGTAALLNALKFRNDDKTWAEVRIYDGAGRYQGTRTMTRSQADTLGAKP